MADIATMVCRLYGPIYTYIYTYIHIYYSYPTKQQICIYIHIYIYHTYIYIDIVYGVPDVELGVGSMGDGAEAEAGDTGAAVNTPKKTTWGCGTGQH